MAKTRKKAPSAAPTSPEAVDEHPVQAAVDAGVRAGDPAALQALYTSLGPVAPDPERRCIAYGYLRLADGAARRSEFASAHQLVRSAAVVRGRPDAVVAIMAGNVSMLEARGVAPEHRSSLYEQGASSYEQAHKTDPKHAAALLSWANALVALARSATDAKANGKPSAKTVKVWALAAEKYAATVALDPTLHAAWTQWGNVLSEQALHAKSDAAGPLLDEACVRYAEAMKLDPAAGAPLVAWGNALLLRGRTRLGAEAAALFDGACEKYKLATALLGDRADVLRNWGSALVARADVTYAETAAATESAADRFRKDAVTKFDRAAGLRERDHGTLYLAAATLLARAATKQGARAEPTVKSLELAESARERISNALLLARGEPSYLFLLARIEARRGESAKTVAALTRWAAAHPKAARRDVDQCPDFEPLRAEERFIDFRRTMGRSTPL